MHTPDGKFEVPDQTPVEMPLGYERPESLESMIARMVRNFSAQAQAHGDETFEEADDFDMNDDSELVSPYQLTDMQEEHPYERTELESLSDPKTNPVDQRAKKESTEKPPQKMAKKAPKQVPSETVEEHETVTQ